MQACEVTHPPEHARRLAIVPNKLVIDYSKINPGEQCRPRFIYDTEASIRSVPIVDSARSATEETSNKWVNNFYSIISLPVFSLSLPRLRAVCTHESTGHVSRVHASRNAQHSGLACRSIPLGLSGTAFQARLIV